MEFFLRKLLALERVGTATVAAVATHACQKSSCNAFFDTVFDTVVAVELVNGQIGFVV